MNRVQNLDSKTQKTKTESCPFRANILRTAPYWDLNKCILPNNSRAAFVIRHRQGCTRHQTIGKAAHVSDNSPDNSRSCLHHQTIGKAPRHGSQSCRPAVRTLPSYKGVLTVTMLAGFIHPANIQNPTSSPSKQYLRLELLELFALAVETHLPTFA